MLVSGRVKKLSRLGTFCFLGGGFNFLYFHPYLGKISNLTNIFQMGWFNHQLDIVDVSEIPHIHLGCISPCKQWDLPTSTGDRRISEPSRVWASSSHFLTSSQCFFLIGLFCDIPGTPNNHL